MSQKVSVLIPTHNRSELLARAIESLRQIQIPQNVDVELIIIANACTDNTVRMIQALAPSMPFPARCVEEPEIGLNHARNRALAEATGEILAFLDDDVWVDSNWLVGLLDVFNDPKIPADIVAGPVELWWEAVDRPSWLEKRSEHLLSAVHHGDRVIELTSAGEAVGANLAFRKTIPQHVGPFAVGLDRRGDLPLGGGDTDFLARALAAGHRLFYAPRAPVKHWVPPQRATPEYLYRVAYGNGLARPFLTPTLSTAAAIGIIIRYSLRTVGYILVEIGSLIIFNRRANIHHHIRRNLSRGNVVGAWRRLFHQSPLSSAPAN